MSAWLRWMHGVIDSVIADPEAEDRFQAWKRSWKKLSKSRGTEAATAKRRAKQIARQPDQPDHEPLHDEREDFEPVVVAAHETVQ